ncbi:HAMP domain-containing sensor histidine kinase [Nocardioides sp. CN2-186]|uniref:sensor histidine kinase n=1 Tax=Nocardioides tweenelious TaxID=3156607 RepID=UPI0032B542CA
MTALGSEQANYRWHRWVLSMADPRGFQIGFTALYALDVGLRITFGFRFAWTSWPAVGLFLAIAALLLGVLAPWDRLSPSAPMMLPLIDLAVIGVTRLTPEGGNGLLVVIPALWLGRRWGRTGAVVTGIGCLALIVVPGLIYNGADPVLLSRTLLIPVVAVVASLSIAAGMDQARAHHGELASALDTIEHQRRVSQAIFDTVDVGLVLLDSTGKYAGMNRRHAQFMELGFPDGHGGRAGQLGAVFDVDGRTPLVREQMPTYRASQGEEFDDLRMWIGVDPEDRRALSVSARTVRTDRGEFAGAALGYTDVTDFMRALRVKDEFIALVSHELRTPLTSIVGYVQLLEEDPELPPHAVDQLAVVQRNAERLRRLIADLLDTAQRDGAPMPINLAPSDLASIVQESVEAARPAAADAGIELELTSPETLTMSLDPQRMAQVVDNLVSNAIKYTESGGLVQVRLAVDEERVELEVVDSGIGISPRDREQLFTRFFRTSDAERRAVSGAGLGLSITKDIVESHGGVIEVESEIGQGSVFRVCLPLRP